MVGLTRYKLHMRCNESRVPTQNLQHQLLQPMKYIVFQVNSRHTFLPSQTPMATHAKRIVLTRVNYATHHSTITKTLLIESGVDLTAVPTFVAFVTTYTMRKIISSDADLLTISLYITAETSTPAHQQEAMVLDRSFNEALNTIPTVPATPDSIRALQELNDVKLSGLTCCVCLENISFGGGKAKVLEMPCSHAFHKDCIVQWLQTSHFCPLCRYSMPATSSSS